MSSSSNSSSSLTSSTTNPQDGSGRTYSSFFPGPFGTIFPSFDADGFINGLYDLEGNLIASNLDTTRRVTISVPSLLGSPPLVTASSQAPRTTPNMAGGGSASRALSSGGGSPTKRSGMMSGVQGSPQVLPVPGSSYPIVGGDSQTHVQEMSSLSSLRLTKDMTTNYIPPFQFGAGMPEGLSLTPRYQLNEESIIQNVDFPALRGYTGNTADYQMDSHHQELMMKSQQSSMESHGGFYFGSSSTSHYPQPQQNAQAVSSGGISSQTGGTPSTELESLIAPMGYDQPLQHHQATSQSPGYTLSADCQPFKPKPDPYSMLALLSVLKNTNPDATTLALGMDLTEVGLDMTSEKSLFKTFASPWANEPLEDDHDEFTIPPCYNARPFSLPPQGRYRIFRLQTLFYIFYSMPQDVMQLYAADELYERGWFFHKVDKRWFIRIGEPRLTTDVYENGTYYCFDPDKFQCVRKEDIFICYGMLERRPSLPQHPV